jgi:hypothetical protein
MNRSFSSIQALFSSLSKIFSLILSNLLTYVEALNMDKKLVEQFGYKSRDESFKPN